MYLENLQTGDILTFSHGEKGIVIKGFRYCDICNREIKESKLHKLEVDSTNYYAAFPFKVFAEYSYCHFDMCKKCYSKLRRFARKLKEK